MAAAVLACVASPAWAGEREPLLPLWAERARERGAPLPPTFGIGVVAVRDQQGVYGDTLSVRLAKGAAPPSDVRLISTPGVSFDNIGDTDSLQIKADVWVLPFLNLFVAVGSVKGDLGIDVLIDLDELLPPPICRPVNPCGEQRMRFNADLDNTTTTVGATAIYGSERWFVAATGSRTVSVAGKRSDVATANLGLRGGPRLKVGDRIHVEPYLGVNWTDMDTTVRGTASLDDAFPDGEALSVRYKARVENADDYALTLGANAEFGERWYLQAEYGHADSGDRFILSTTYRF